MMNSFPRLRILVIAILFAGAALAPTFAHATGAGELRTHGDDAIDRLHATIDSGIVMLESQHYRLFLERFIQPSEKKKVMEGMDMDAKARQFGMEKADRLLEVLKRVRHRKPKITENGSRASFKLPKKIGSHDSLEFNLVDGLWYLRD